MRTCSPLPTHGQHPPRPTRQDSLRTLVETSLLKYVEFVEEHCLAAVQVLDSATVTTDRPPHLRRVPLFAVDLMFVDGDPVEAKAARKMPQVPGVLLDASVWFSDALDGFEAALLDSFDYGIHAVRECDTPFLPRERFTTSGEGLTELRLAKVTQRLGHKLQGSNPRSDAGSTLCRLPTASALSDVAWCVVCMYRCGPFRSWNR